MLNQDVLLDKIDQMSDEEILQIMREVFEESNIPYHVQAGGFNFPGLGQLYESKVESTVCAEIKQDETRRTTKYIIAAASNEVSALFSISKGFITNYGTEATVSAAA